MEHSREHRALAARYEGPAFGKTFNDGPPINVHGPRLCRWLSADVRSGSDRELRISVHLIRCGRPRDDGTTRTRSRRQLHTNDAPASHRNKRKEPTGVGCIDVVSVQVTSGRGGCRVGNDSWWRCRKKTIVAPL